MGIWDLFSGKSAQKHEESGDYYLSQEKYGDAKLDFERALAKLHKDSASKIEDIDRINTKLVQTKENLSKFHHKTAQDLINVKLFDEALELLDLALELTNDENRAQELKSQIKIIHEGRVTHQYPNRVGAPDAYDTDTGISDDHDHNDWDWKEHFEALYNALPEEEQSFYGKYNDTFKKGFVALNTGDFEIAGELLTQAIEENQNPGYINLELATAYLNIGELEAAKTLLSEFIESHPRSLRAYALMCDILWENKAFEQCFDFLQTCPKDLQGSLQMILLTGETLVHLKQYEAVDQLYQEFVKTNGWQEPIARSLAGMFEISGKTEAARDVYETIMNSCQSCRTSIDPYIKQRYADTCFATNKISSRILELYFELTQEDPENNADYFQKISQIYNREGNMELANKYKTFSDNAQP